MKNKRSSYVISNLVKGLFWLGVFILIYILFKKYINLDFLTWLRPFFENEALILFIFVVSEVIVGIIPPEVFIIWALRNDQPIEFFFWVSILAAISFCAGIAGFYIGRYLNRTLFFQWTKKRFLNKLDDRLQIFGGYLIVIASLSPVPFSGVCMLVGSSNYPFKKFFLFALARFLKFAIGAMVFLEIDPNL
jgi:uncharacterized membrane protein YdjX (TVP38/TMEM64 family)